MLLLGSFLSCAVLKPQAWQVPNREQGLPGASWASSALWTEADRGCRPASGCSLLMFRVNRIDKPPTTGAGIWAVSQTRDTSRIRSSFLPFCLPPSRFTSSPCRLQLLLAQVLERHTLRFHSELLNHRCASPISIPDKPWYSNTKPNLFRQAPVKLLHDAQMNVTTVSVTIKSNGNSSSINDQRSTARKQKA